MKVGIIGSGIVGRVLATAFLKEGHEVMLGTRDVSKEEVVKWKDSNKNGLTGIFEKTAQFGELVVLAVSGSVAKEALLLAGLDNLSGKTVIDATNPIAAAPPVNGVLQFFTGPNDSLMERLQQQAPDARFVKAFSCVGNAFMYKPAFPGGTPTMFICGNDDEAKKAVVQVLDSFGWETEDLGKAEAARAIEPLCILWCIPGMIGKGWGHALKLLRM